MRVAVIEKACVEIQIPTPIFIRLRQIHRAVEIKPKAITKRFPNLGVPRAIKFDFRPGAFHLVLGAGAVKIKGDIHQFITDQCIRVKKHKGRIVRDMCQTFDFIAIGIICPECLVFKRNYFGV